MWFLWLDLPLSPHHTNTTLKKNLMSLLKLSLLTLRLSDMTDFDCFLVSLITFFFHGFPLIGFQVWMSSLSETPKKSVTPGKFFCLGVMHAIKTRIFEFKLCVVLELSWMLISDSRYPGSVVCLCIGFSWCTISGKEEELCFSDD